MNVKWLALLVVASCVGCSDKGPAAQKPAQFPDTPEGVVLRMEEAFRNHDLDAAASCRAFQHEAELDIRNMIELAAENKKKSGGKKVDAKGNNIEVPELEENAATVGQFASQRDFFFRDEIKKRGFPNFDGVTSTFTDKKEGADGIVTLTEVCKFPDGHTSTNEVKTVKTPAGWKVFVAP